VMAGTAERLNDYGIYLGLLSVEKRSEKPRERIKCLHILSVLEFVDEVAERFV
jgi:hypothetical protein